MWAPGASVTRAGVRPRSTPSTNTATPAGVGVDHQGAHRRRDCRLRIELHRDHSGGREGENDSGQDRHSRSASFRARRRMRGRTCGERRVRVEQLTDLVRRLGRLHRRNAHAEPA